MAKKDPFMNRPLHTKLTNEQCCQLIAIRDVQGAKAAEAYYGVSAKTQVSLSQRIKTRPDLERVYWQYRNAIARRWASALSETAIAVLGRINEEVAKPTMDLLALRELTRTFETLGDVSVSVEAVAPASVQEDTPLFEAIDVEDDRGTLLLSEAKDGVFS